MRDLGALWVIIRITTRLGIPADFVRIAKAFAAKPSQHRARARVLGHPGLRRASRRSVHCNSIWVDGNGDGPHLSRREIL